MERGSKERIIVTIIKKGGTPFCYQFEQICGEWDFNVAIIVTIIKKGGALIEDGENCGEWDGQTANSNDGSLS